jgi:hypothetical protein
MTAHQPAQPRHLHAYLVPGDRYALVRLDGDGSEWLRARGVPAQYRRIERGLSIRAERLSDVLAMAQAEHIFSYCHEKTAP